MVLDNRILDAIKDDKKYFNYLVEGFFEENADKIKKDFLIPPEDLPDPFPKVYPMGIIKRGYDEEEIMEALNETLEMEKDSYEIPSDADTLKKQFQSFVITKNVLEKSFYVVGNLHNYNPVSNIGRKIRKNVSGIYEKLMDVDWKQVSADEHKTYEKFMENGF